MCAKVVHSLWITCPTGPSPAGAAADRSATPPRSAVRSPRAVPTPVASPRRPHSCCGLRGRRDRGQRRPRSAPTACATATANPPRCARSDPRARPPPAASSGPAGTAAGSAACGSESATRSRVARCSLHANRIVARPAAIPERGAWVGAALCDAQGRRRGVMAAGQGGPQADGAVGVHGGVDRFSSERRMRGQVLSVGLCMTRLIRLCGGRPEGRNRRRGGGFRGFEAGASGR